MNLETIKEALLQERKRIDSLLQVLGQDFPSTFQETTKEVRRKFSSRARQNMSASAKERWARYRQKKTSVAA